MNKKIMQKLRRFCDTKCDCGKLHDFYIDDIIIEKGTINRFFEVLSRYHAEKVFLFASPWSPPAYMKDNEYPFEGGSLKEEYKSVWAHYYARFIKAPCCNRRTPE